MAKATALFVVATTIAAIAGAQCTITVPPSGLASDAANIQNALNSLQPNQSQ